MCSFLSRFIAIPLVVALVFTSGCTCGGPLPGGPGDGGDGGDGGASTGAPDAGDGGAGGDGGTVDHRTLKSLSLSPENPQLLTDGTTPATQAFTLTAHYTDGTSADVSSQALFQVDNDHVGAFTGATFTSATYGGSADVNAQMGGMGVGTLLTVKVQRVYNDPGATVPSNPSAPFTGPQVTTGAVVPDVVYPNDGVLLPPNLSKLELHFLPGTGNTLFELSFSNPVTDLKVYTRCTSTAGGCVYMPDTTVWRWLSETNRGGTPVQIGLRGVKDATAGAQVGVSSTIAMSFAPDDVNGALYYWTTTGDKGIMRFAFGSKDTTATNFAGTAFTGGTCVGCHALSRDGTKMVAEAGGQNDGRLLMMNVGTTTTMNSFGSAAKSIFESWNPDGSKFVGVYGDNNATDYNLHIQSGTTGAIELNISGTGDSTHPADHPDWSPTGDKIVYTRVGSKNTLQKMGLGAIQVVQLNGGTWSSATTLVPQANSKNHYYPSFAPDGKFIVYDESTCPAGTAAGTYVKDCNADTDPSAKLYALSTAAAGGAPIALAKINAPGKGDGGNTNLTNSYPKWSPFINKGAATGSRLMWITFASTRKFGLKTPPAGGDENPSGTWLWMAAIDPDKVAQGLDPSYPPFYLPYQEAGTSNHIAQWAETLVDHCQARNGNCQQSADCCSGMTCYTTELIGTCQPAGTCANQGAACGGNLGCCSGSGLQCLQANGAACQDGTSCSCETVIR